METTQYTHLCEAERYMIVTGLEAGHSIRQIAKNLQRSSSSISREIHRNGTNVYAALLAHTQAKARRHKPRIIKKLDIIPLLRSYVFGKVDRYWSPQQISARLKMDFPDNPDMRVSHETIYAYIYAMPKSQLRQVLIANLRRKHPERQNPSRTLSDRGRIADMVSKGSDLSHRTQEELDEISHLLNTRPRKSLGYLTPKEVYMSDFKLYHPDYNRCCT